MVSRHTLPAQSALESEIPFGPGGADGELAVTNEDSLHGRCILTEDERVNSQQGSSHYPRMLNDATRRVGYEF